MKLEQSILIAVLVGFASACAAEQPPRAAAPAATPPASSLEATASPTRAVVSISDDIRKACGISDTEAHFPFDSAQVESVDYPTLERLVRCFASGPLADRAMRLVGHADPRGEAEYNLALGGSRADRVKMFLTARGLAEHRVATTSRGETDARGSDEATWAEDRRVDVLLAN